MPEPSRIILARPIDHESRPCHNASCSDATLLVGAIKINRVQRFGCQDRLIDIEHDRGLVADLGPRCGCRQRSHAIAEETFAVVQVLVIDRQEAGVDVVGNQAGERIEGARSWRSGLSIRSSTLSSIGTSRSMPSGRRSIVVS